LTFALTESPGLSPGLFIWPDAPTAIAASAAIT